MKLSPSEYPEAARGYEHVYRCNDMLLALHDAVEEHRTAVVLADNSRHAAELIDLIAGLLTVMRHVFKHRRQEVELSGGGRVVAVIDEDWRRR